jgi:hypothetical protein
MSKENVGVVQAATDAFARDGVDGWLEYFTDDVDYRAAEGAIDDRGPIHGKDALRAYAEDWGEMFDDVRSSRLRSSMREMTRLSRSCASADVRRGPAPRRS